MSTPSAKLLVYVNDGLARIKIAGRANVALSIDFKRLVNELISRGFSCFVIDLSECLLMDSTFLGVLAGFGLRLALRQNGSPGEPSIELFNPNVRIAELLENLGVAHLFKIRRGASDAARNGSVPAEAAVTDHPREEVTRNCLEAHRVLMSLDPAMPSSSRMSRSSWPRTWKKSKPADDPVSSRKSSFLPGPPLIADVNKAPTPGCRQNGPILFLADLNSLRTFSERLFRKSPESVFACSEQILPQPFVHNRDAFPGREKISHAPVVVILD